MIRRILVLAAALLVLGAAPAFAQYSPNNVVVTPSTTPGGPINVSGCCFEPGTTVQVTLNGTPLGTLVADSSGNVSGTFTVPAGFPIGTATVTLTGTAMGSNVPGSLVLSTTVQIVSATPTTASNGGTGRLPVTGSDYTMTGAALGAGLIVVGGIILLSVRRRRGATIGS